MVKNTQLISFAPYRDAEYGYLVALEGQKEIPFDIKRAYYIYNVPEGTRRGFHAHEDLEQVLICVCGQVTLLVKTPFESEEIVLDTPDKGLYIGAMVWREMFDFSPGAVLLVLASKLYAPSDYIRSYDVFEKMARTRDAQERG